MGSDMKPSVMLFAAGLGTRMGPMVQDRPKPLIKVAGRSLIDHALELTDTAGLMPPVVNLHYKPDMVRAHLAQRNVVFSDETDDLLETGGGLRRALPLLGDGPVVTLNTDAVWNGSNPIDQLLSQWRDEMEALLVLVPKDNAYGHKGTGDFERASDGRLSRGADYVYTGLQMIRTDTLSDISDKAFSMNVLWNRMDARGGLFGTVWDGDWCDVGQPESIAIAERMLDV